MAQSASSLQAELAKSPAFLSRIQQMLVTIASQVLIEQGVGNTHAARAAYAKFVLSAPASAATLAAPFLAQTGNVAPNIQDSDTGVVTTSTDAEIQSQINTSWNILAGIDSGN